jgi:hypothetical protein
MHLKTGRAAGNLTPTDTKDSIWQHNKNKATPVTIEVAAQA